MDTIASPKSVNKNIDQLKARLQQLQEQETRLTEQRRELLTRPQDVKTAQALTQIETEFAGGAASKGDRREPLKGSGRAFVNVSLTGLRL